MKVFSAVAFFATLCIVSCAVEHVAAGTIVLGETRTVSSKAAVSQTSVEFYLDRTGADDGASLSVGNFQIRVALTGPGAGSMVRIMGAGETTSRNQAFALDSTATTAGTSAFAATLNLAAPFAIADGGGLVKLNLEIQPGALGSYALTVQPGVGNTELTNPNDFATPLPIDTGIGLLNIVPEPATTSLLIAAAIGVAAMRRGSRTVFNSLSMSFKG